jgi:tetratricopeptide (TPR) repeat protein
MEPGFRKNDRCEWGWRRALDLAVLALIAFWPALLPAATQDGEELFTPFIVATNALSPMDQSLLARSDGQRESPGPIEYQQIMHTVILLIKGGHYLSAISLLEPYRSKDDFLTQHAIGVAYLRVGRNQEAYEALLRAHQLNPTAAAPLLPAALACARMAKRCDDYRSLALEYTARGGKFTRLADKIANHLPITLTISRRS